MLKGISLIDLATKITSQQKQKADYVAPAKEFAMDIDAGGSPRLISDVVAPMPIRPLAHDQLGSHLKIPAKYYDRMLADAPDLLADNVNRWLQKSTERRMLRTLDGSLRAFLSDRYARIENEEIAETVLPILLNTPGLTIVSCEVTERRMYINATTDRITADVKVGDAVQAGIAIGNSEVGLGSLYVKPLIYRLRCLNGMISEEGKMTARHVGRRIGEEEDLNRIYADDTLRADDRALLLKVRDTVQFALQEDRFQRAVAKMQGLTGPKISGDPAKAVEILAQKIGVTEDERGGILRSLIEGADLSAWGVLNAVTHQGHSARSYDRSMEFTTMGGHLLDLPRKDWAEILEAA